MTADTSAAPSMIEIGVRLIENPQGRCREHDARHRKAPALPGREESGRLVVRFGKANPDQCGDNLAWAKPSSQPGVERQVLARGQFRLESIAVSEVAEACAPLVTLRMGRAALPFDRSLLRREEACDHAKKCRLA